MLGFSGGVMLAASYCSLLAPAVAIAEEGDLPGWLPPAVGFLLGGGVLWAAGPRPFARARPSCGYRPRKTLLRHSTVHWRRRGRDGVPRGSLAASAARRSSPSGVAILAFRATAEPRRSSPSKLARSSSPCRR